MNSLTSDWIAIDTNVFEHLMNPEKNVNNHISILFKRFIDNKISLLVDNKKKIITEYDSRISAYLKNPEKGVEYRLLKSFFEYGLGNNKKIVVDLNDALMISITKVIPAHKGADRFFVYVAFKRGRILITNDREDMIDQNNQKGKKRKELLKKTKRYRCKEKEDILTSEEAYRKLQ